MRLTRKRQSEDSNALNVLWTHFVPLDQPKKDLRKVEKAIFQLLLFHFELNFCLFISSKSDLDEVDKRWLKFSHRTLNSFSVSWPAQNATCVRIETRCFKEFEIWPLNFQADLELWTSKFDFVILNQILPLLQRKKWLTRRR